MQKGLRLKTIFMLSIFRIAGKECGMSYIKRKLEELNVLDDFLISTLATDEEVGGEFCRELLSILLQKKLVKLKWYLKKQLWH